MALAELAPARSVKIMTPRVARSSVGFECVLHSNVTMSANQFIALGRIAHVLVNDEIGLDAQASRLDTNAMHLIGGMHGTKWSTQTSDHFFHGLTQLERLDARRNG